MNMKKKLEEITSLHSVINSSWLRIEWLDEALDELKNNLAEAERKHDELVKRREQLMHEVGKWAVIEGIAGVDDHLPMLEPVHFVLTMYDLLEKQGKPLPEDEILD